MGLGDSEARQRQGGPRHDGGLPLDIHSPWVIQRLSGFTAGPEIRRWCWVLMAVGAIAFVMGQFTAVDRTWATLLLTGQFLVGLGLGGLFLMAMHYLTGAAWSVAIRRIPEAMASLLPAGLLAVGAVLILHPSLYDWTRDVEHEASAGFRGLWLNYRFFLLRGVIYALVWLVFAAGLIGNSRAQDRDGSAAHTRRNVTLSAGFTVLFAVSYWLASVDWIMSLEHHWYSTIFGVYNFAGLFASAVACAILVAVWLRNQGVMRGVIFDDHLHDLGKLLLGATTLWAYIWFSQYMLIWYANIPEETIYYVHRQEGTWAPLFFMNPVLNWVVPFFILLPRGCKRNGSVLGRVAAVVLVGRWLDLYLMIFPSVSEGGVTFGVWEVAITLGASGLTCAIILRALSRATLVPLKDPYLDKSLHYHKLSGGISAVPPGFHGRRRSMRESLATRERPRDRSHRAALFCNDLPCQPNEKAGTILVTGASGYIGGRLVPELLARGYQVRVMVRAASSEYTWRWPGVEVAVADVLSGAGLRDALLGVDTAYYLIHSLLLGPKQFAEADTWAAHNFRKAAEEAQVARIIYLGGLGDLTAQLSPHLRSRMEVAAELQRASIPVTVLRASVIIGSGSASYEIIEHLARSSRFMLAPRWADNRCQPIGIRDVIKYLVGALETPETEGRSFDIGGCDILTYRQMLKHIARVLGRPIFIVTGPSLSIGFYAYLASLRTPVPVAITRCLFGGLQNEVVCQDDTIKSLLPFEPIGYEEAVRRAMRMEEQDSIRTRWSDAYPPSHASALKLHELKNPPKYVARYSLTTHATPEALFRSICKIGGKHGWFRNNWMWRLRGMIDRILLGVGTSRGRRSYSTLDIDDVIDFWRVEDLEPNRRLLLRAEMILPGRAWLEFGITGKPDHNVLTISAYFDTCTIRGTLYWCFFMPFHRFIFMHLIQQIERTSLR